MINPVVSVFITNNYDHLKSCVKNIRCGCWSDDVFQECLIMFINTSTGTTIPLIKSQDAVRYFVRMYRLNCQSSNSPFQYRYNRHNHLLDTIYEKEENLSMETQTVDEYIDRIDIIEMKEILHHLSIFWVDKLVFLHYFEQKSRNSGYSFQQMGDECDFSPRKLSRKYEKVRGILYKWYVEKTSVPFYGDKNGQIKSLPTIHDKFD